MKRKTESLPLCKDDFANDGGVMGWQELLDMFDLPPDTETVFLSATLISIDRENGDSVKAL